MYLIPGTAAAAAAVPLCRSAVCDSKIYIKLDKRTARSLLLRYLLLSRTFGLRIFHHRIDDASTNKQRRTQNWDVLLVLHALRTTNGR